MYYNVTHIIIHTSYNNNNNNKQLLLLRLYPTSLTIAE